MYICGPAGIGKSSIALELVDRGHQLVADDVVHFESDQKRVTGLCPDSLRGYIGLRDTGMLDISRLYGPNALCHSCPLELVIALNEPVAHSPRLDVIHAKTTILNVSFPQININVIKYRNIALVIETAVKNYILYRQGLDANRQFEQKQQHKS